ncbi:putative RNA binding protein [Tothia fuscella]|uniref:RNA binding protein n=1 Tax=Tothia fuscella TaxID=1048955 RepID=A0A9P4U3D8_9PEZI|nr:putative RNA binding protein [Tothia fuscella]
MTRADTQQVKVHFKGSKDDFIVMAESVEAVKKWKEDKSVPLVEVVNSFDVFHTDGHGVQGELNRASNQLLETEFGTKNSDEVVQKILEQGEVQEVKNAARQGDRNIANSGKVAH